MSGRDQPGVCESVVGAPGLPPGRRLALAKRVALELLKAGEQSRAEAVTLSAADRLPSAALRAELLAATTEAILRQGGQPRPVRDAYAARLVVADELLREGDTDAAGTAFEAAVRLAFHRVLHFDHLSSPIAADPSGFTQPLRNSSTAQAVRAPRGRRCSHAAPGGSPTRLLLATRKNADFLGEISEHLTGVPGLSTTFHDFVGTGDLERFFKSPAAIVRQTLGNKKALRRAADMVFRPYLDDNDVVFVEWCTALAALLTQVDPGDTRIVVRMHSYEAFTWWPHLMDFSRVDDMVFVSDHLRDLAVASIPALQEANRPRLHVIPNAMPLRRFALPKPPEARFTLGIVGASKLVKDPRWAIEVLRHLRRHDERYRLLLIRGHLQDPTAASHAYAGALERDLAELQPTGAVEVLGHTDDVPAALQQVGVVVSSSVRESFHLGVVEGAASGAVPVVRDWPYFPGAARELFPADWVVDDPEAAAQRILAATASEEAWRETGEAASRHVIAKWDWEVVKHDFERLLRPNGAA